LTDDLEKWNWFYSQKKRSNWSQSSTVPG